MAARFKTIVSTTPEHETILTDGRFRIAMRAYAVTECIEHKCSQPPIDTRYREGQWYPHAWSIEWRASRCLYCGERPSDGLQASFWFLRSAAPY